MSYNFTEEELDFILKFKDTIPGSLQKPYKRIIKTQEEILNEIAIRDKERSYEKYREDKDAAWKERRRQQSIADKLKNKKS